MKQDYNTWIDAFLANAKTIQNNEARYTYNVNDSWGNMDDAINDINIDEETSQDVHNIGNLHNATNEQYDLQSDFDKIHHTSYLRKPPKPFEFTPHPHLLDNTTYYSLRRQLNREQQTIVKDILLRKQIAQSEPLHLFLTGGAGTGKTFTAKAMYQGLLRIYNNTIGNDPDKTKGLLLAYTGKAAYNLGGTTLHSALLIPFNKSVSTPLSSERLDMLSK